MKVDYFLARRNGNFNQVHQQELRFTRFGVVRSLGPENYREIELMICPKNKKPRLLVIHAYPCKFCFRCFDTSTSILYMIRSFSTFASKLSCSGIKWILLLVVCRDSNQNWRMRIVIIVPNTCGNQYFDFKDNEIGILLHPIEAGNQFRY